MGMFTDPNDVLAAYSTGKSEAAFAAFVAGRDRILMGMARRQAIEECAKLFDVVGGCWMCEQEARKPGSYEIFQDGLNRDCHEHENDWCVCANWPGKMIRALLNPPAPKDLENP